MLLMALAGPAHSLEAQGGPPLETDDPGTPGPGHVELNISVEAEREGSGTLYDAPLFDLNVGVGTKLQAKVEVPWRVATGASGPTQTGLGNFGFGMKWRFAETRTVGLSTYPQVTLEALNSSLQKGVADSGTTLLLPLQVAWDPGSISVNADLGYELGLHAPQLEYGLAVARDAGPALELLGECHGGGDSDLTGQGVRCGVGFRWELQRSLVLLAAFGAGVAGSPENRPDHRLFTGAQLRW